MNKGKLLYILPEYSSNSSSHYYNLSELLERNSNIVKIALFIEKGENPGFLEQKVKIYRQQLTLPPFGLLERFFIFLGFRSQGYRTAYVHYSYWSAIIASLIFRPTGGKVYFWHCETFENYHAHLTNDFTGLRRRLTDHWPMLLTLRLVNYLVTGTETVGDFYEKTFGVPHDKIKILPNWVNLQRFMTISKTEQIRLRRKLKFLPEDKVVLFVHRLVPRKGTGYLPELIQNVISEVPEARFVIIGGGPDEKKLKTELAGQKKSVRVLGAIPNKEISKYFSLADLLIMPSRQEGFPRVLLESMAMKVPFVAFNVGGVRDILTPKQKKYVAEPGDLKTFSSFAVQLLKSLQRRQELIYEGTKQVQKYDLEKAASLFIGLFKE
ncbi:glycosyltransferase family 4 protein [Patescibacteria group bacterium]|nr:glycosyltransferase family 4 protein [Patescibacteria group bacterium]